MLEHLELQSSADSFQHASDSYDGYVAKWRRLVRVNLLSFGLLVGGGAAALVGSGAMSHHTPPACEASSSGRELLCKDTPADNSNGVLEEIGVAGMITGFVGFSISGVDLASNLSDINRTALEKRHAQVQSDQA